MTHYLKVSPRAIVVEREVAAYPPQTAERFLGDPAGWLPGRTKMHGGTVFHTQVRASGATLELEWTVGTPWTRGATTTRRLRAGIIDAPHGPRWALAGVDGELSLARRRDQAFLRFEGAPSASWPRRVRLVVARRLMRTVVAQIAERLVAPGLPARPSRA